MIRLKKGWQIAKLGKNIEKAFKSGDKIVKFAVLDQQTKVIQAIVYYTPVNARLRKMGEKLGDYLHSMKVYRPPDDPWWKKTREFMEAVFTELEKANVGTLLGVPILNIQTRQMSITIEPTSDGRFNDWFMQFGKPGIQVLVEVSYLDELPIKI